MTAKKLFFLMLGVMVIMMIIINLMINTSNSNADSITEDYFTNLELEVSGTICAVEKQTDTYKYLITLKDIKANTTDYTKPSPLGVNFCVIKGAVAIFADHYDGYKIGDTIRIGENKTDLIKCISTDGTTRFIRKRSDAMLYTVASPNKRMKQLIVLGCQ
ncbi:hypothetical protein [Cellulophaga sp. Z1A5H]|uniref:hypothetical protein n=1 Tax=Cellulophaga sp. Z1A5H TaxID=2687291 RepID=UPI0013FDB592|nr:hypothetical protein [Cellulophaga sp. Z1A5H]